ncbi:hypothetical protein GGD81_001280 [Rhodobium orientis]|uniref:Imelysin-like domain-containing protein n=1 Tax=Rhodobium orientis TaxID=34017 RepID=A0A327JSC4_9HYPH|nr:hypothetical protein [Rhodobium orientis]MBB4302253.1 hypothetical protein [Rhodobium orientis]MBK5948964.1 hypothetical protein [Rhodobium orientis]RAI28961.1 hypothetical protein CH339_04545 [Rhodobium orientis]
MLKSILYGAIFVLALPAGAAAGETASLLKAIDGAFAHYREAVSYLRTGNTDLAAIELESMGDGWKSVAAEYGTTPPDGFDGNALYDRVMSQTGPTLDEALALIDAGKAEAARDLLVPLRGEMVQFRAESRIYTLTDCLFEASTAMDGLFAYKGKPPAHDDWTARADAVGKAAVYGATLERCDALAIDDVKADPEFRRLVDGAIASSARIAEAIGAKDDGLLYRLLIELRSLDRLMFYRFG